MTRSIKRIIGLIFTGFLLGIGGAVWLYFDEIPPPPVNDYLVEFPEINSRIYMRSREWGLAGNHEETRLQTSAIDNAEPCLPGTCLVIHASEIYYERYGVDTLRVFAVSSAVPRHHPKALGTVKLEVRELHTYEQLREEAAKRGLSKVISPVADGGGTKGNLRRTLEN